MPFYKRVGLLQLHCPKTGGTSFENTICSVENLEEFDFAESRKRYKALDRRWQEEFFYGYTQLSSDTEFVLQHATFAQLQEFGYLSLDVLQTDMKILMVVRNPYDRMVSEYKWRALFGFKGTFDEFVEVAATQEWHKSSIFEQHFLPQADFVRGIPLAHPHLHIVHFENMKLLRFFSSWGPPI